MKMNKAILTCPKCNHNQEMEIPEGKCLPFHKCENCKEIISVPKDSKNCCVVCEYSNKNCPVAYKK